MGVDQHLLIKYPLKSNGFYPTFWTFLRDIFLINNGPNPNNLYSLELPRWWGFQKCICIYFNFRSSEAQNFHLHFLSYLFYTLNIFFNAVLASPYMWLSKKKKEKKYYKMASKNIFMREVHLILKKL